MDTENAVTDADRIRKLNDRLRKTFTGGAICITRGVADRCDVNAVLAAVQAFDTFDNLNDPFGERDFGILELDGQTIFWKVDYYGQNMQGSSANAADESVTERVLTIYLDVES